jgi:nitrate reductase delta subunit
MLIFKLLAELLDYPGEALVSDLREFVKSHGGSAPAVAALDPQRVFAATEHAAIAHFVDWMLGEDQTELEANYVKTFDMVPEHSLHLTHHLFGDDKNRGPALIDLSEFYKSYGLQHEEREIPDFLPMMLEFVAQLDVEEARVFLADAARIFQVLASNLESADSPYAALVRIIENHASLARLATA